MTKCPLWVPSAENPERLGKHQRKTIFLSFLSLDRKEAFPAVGLCHDDIWHSLEHLNTVNILWWDAKGAFLFLGKRGAVTSSNENQNRNNFYLIGFALWEQKGATNMKGMQLLTDSQPISNSSSNNSNSQTEIMKQNPVRFLFKIHRKNSKKTRETKTT